MNKETMKKIFTSQGNLNLGRNREHRRLEAKLDNEEPEQCKHKKYCPLKQYSMKCVFNRNNCQSYKFYEKYGEGYNHLGVGS